MDRRAFLGALGLLAAPVAEAAQQATQIPRIGVLMGFAESDPRAQVRLAAFRKGLQALGWVEGHNVHTHIRWATTSDAPLMQLGLLKRWHRASRGWPCCSTRQRRPMPRIT
jgi:hypothetical protein